MALTCNIDAKGKKVRLINGIVTLVLALLVLGIWAIPVGSIVAWGLFAFLLLAGGFMIFEARAGWCVMRALGFKTPI